MPFCRTALGRALDHVVLERERAAQFDRQCAHGVVDFTRGCKVARVEPDGMRWRRHGAVREMATRVECYGLTRATRTGSYAIMDAFETPTVCQSNRAAASRQFTNLRRVREAGTAIQGGMQL